MRKKFGQVLLEQGLITPEQLADALTHQSRNGMRLGQALVARGHITEDQLVIALGQSLSMRVVDLSRVQPDAEALEMVRPGFASEHDLFPISVRRDRGRTHLTVAVSDPLNLKGLDALGFKTSAQIEPVLAKSTAIDMAIRRHYGPVISRMYGEASESTPPAAGAERAARGDGEDRSSGVQSAGPSEPPIPLTQRKRPSTGFDAELGALLEAVGDADDGVDDEAFSRLERRFWALMRVLAKKGLVSNEEFLHELNEEETAWRSRG